MTNDLVELILQNTDAILQLRVEREDHAAQLIPAATALAANIADELHLIRLDDGIRVYDDRYEKGFALYTLEIAQWKTGRIGRRAKHSSPVLTFRPGILQTVLLHSPNHVFFVPGQAVRGFSGALATNNGSWNSVNFATATQLANFSCHAEEIIETVLRRESNKTELLSIGLERADIAIGLMEQLHA